MAQVILFTNKAGGVSVCIPTGEIPIEQVLIKDCPKNSIIIDDAELPTEYFEAWELVNGKVVVNEAKKLNIQQESKAKQEAELSALNKLKALGLTDNEISALTGKQ